MNKQQAVEAFHLPKAMLPYLPDPLPSGISYMWQVDKGFCWEVWYEQEGVMRKMWIMKEPAKS